MNFETFLRLQSWDGWVLREFQNRLHEVCPQLNLKSTVIEVTGFPVSVPIPDPAGWPPKMETETVYVPRLDFKGRLLLALGALFDSPQWWNQGFIPEKRPKMAMIREFRLTILPQNFGVRQAISRAYAGWARSHDDFVDHYLQAGYCAYNDTLYVRK